VSPYIHPFVAALQLSGHHVVVVIPDGPISWIGKAHAVSRTLTARSVCPASLVGSVCSSPACDKAEDRSHRWLVVDGSPASCVQIGLFHAGSSPDDFDMVISGPNHGRNASTIYGLSSGTVGGALEAALCRRKAVAVSFGSKDPQPEEVIQLACRRAVGLVEALLGAWHAEAELYSVNVPMHGDLATVPVRYATMADSYWTKGSLFAPVLVRRDDKMLRSYQFRWKPELSDIRAAEEESIEGDDLWASLNGYISVTPLKASLTVVGVHDRQLHVTHQLTPHVQRGSNG
jgi:5'/3'-nucleotidase SurE